MNIYNNYQQMHISNDNWNTSQYPVDENIICILCVSVHVCYVLYIKHVQVSLFLRITDYLNSS